MKINIEKSQIWTPYGSPSPPISLLLVRSCCNFHTICKIGKETLFVHEGLVFHLYIQIYINIYIYIKELNFLIFYASMKKKSVLESLKDFLQNVQYIFFHFLFRFLLKTKINEPPPSLPPPLFPPFWGGSSAASPLEIWDVMPPYLKTLFEQKTEI